MQKQLRYSLVYVLLAFFSLQCDKPQDDSLYTGKVELEGICGRIVISITNGNLADLPRSSYADSWRDESTGISYSNVFMVSNSCQLQPSLKKGDLITFRVHPQPDTACIVCQAVSPAPPNKLPIEIISRFQ